MKRIMKTMVKMRTNKTVVKMRTIVKRIMKTIVKMRMITSSSTVEPVLGDLWFGRPLALGDHSPWVTTIAGTDRF